MIGLLLLAAVPAFAQDATQMFVATPTAIPAPSLTDPRTYSQGTPRTLGEISFSENICPEELLAANRKILPANTVSLIEEQKFIKHALWVEIPVELTIPDHEDCYEVVNRDFSQLPQVEIDYNVCVEDLYFYGRNGTAFYVRKDAMPCVNEQGQRLQYYKAERTPYDIPVYSDVPFIEGPADITQLGYCIRDLVRANPGIYFNMPNPYDYGDFGYMTGMRLFVPEDASNCGSIPALSGNLYEVSRQQNVCMETLLETTGVKLIGFEGDYGIPLQFPVSSGPCYDENGQRIGYKDRLVYVPQDGESFLDIARAHNVCLQDLWDHNPVMNAWYEWPYSLPDVVFIPDTAPCDQHRYTVQTTLTWHGLSLLTNTCINRLIEANLSLKSAWLDDLPVGKTLTIPQRPHCYDLTNTQNGFEMQPYICYNVPVTAESDFTGHQPAISAALNTDLPYCYDREQGITVFSNNEPYTLYMVRGYETFVVLSQCFGVKPEELYILNLYDSFHNAWSVTPASYTTTYQGPILVPQPHADCLLLVEDNSLHWQRYVEMTYQAGSLQDGVYTVNYGDTLSSIGRKYGYLPQSIAEANDLGDSTMIFYLQELKMPSYPSLYTLAPVGAGVGSLVLAGGLFYGLRRWSRARGKSKKKNS